MLDSLPSEITTKIVAFVDEPDLLNLRLASRRLQQETWHAFGAAFFTTLYFDFCLGSFTHLQRVAQHDGLRLFPRELRVGDRESCSDARCRTLRADHRLGQGYRWPRELSGCIDVAAPELPPAARLLRAALAERLVHCRAICMRQGAHDRPGERGGDDDRLSTADAVHLLLVAAAGLPLRSLRFEALAGLGLQAQELPRRAIIEPPPPPPLPPPPPAPPVGAACAWADALTELRLDWEMSVFPPDQDQDQEDGSAGLVDTAAGIITRARALRRLHLDLFERDASALLGRLMDAWQAAPPPQELTHLVLKRLRARGGQLSSFLRRCSGAGAGGSTLRHLHVSSVTLTSPSDDGDSSSGGEEEGGGWWWAGVLAGCGRGGSLSSRLEHFTLADARCLVPDVGGASQEQRLEVCFFDHMLEWTEAPASGRAEFLVKPVRTSGRFWRFRISGVRYEGQCDHVREFLAGLEECARVSSQNHGNEAAMESAGWERKDLPLTLVIAGKLKAERFQAKKFLSIFDRPSDRVPLHDWP